MKDLGEVTTFLGIKIERDLSKKIIKLSQKQNLKIALNRFGLDESKSCSNPMEPYLKLPNCNDKTTSQSYRELAGCLMYLTLLTRPDILHGVRCLCEYQSNPSETHLLYLKRVLRYLKGSADMKLEFNSKQIILKTYCDSDHANDKGSQKSISGFVVEVVGCPVS